MLAYSTSHVFAPLDIQPFRETVAPTQAEHLKLFRVFIFQKSLREKKKNKRKRKKHLLLLYKK